MDMTIKALTFDTIGTVVDYRSMILREGSEWSRAKGLNADWPAFVAEWRKQERLGQERVERGEWPWTNRDPPSFAGQSASQRNPERSRA